MAMSESSFGPQREDRDDMDGGAPSNQGRGRDVTGRARLLDAATDLVMERLSDGMPVEAIFSHLTPAAVAERAGVSRGLIYHYWAADRDDAAAPFAELLAEVVERVFDRTADWERLGEFARDMPSDRGALIRAFTDFELQQMAGPDLRPVWRARLLLKICGVAPSAGPVDLHEHLDVVHEQLMQLHGLRMKGQLEVRDLTHALVAFNDGMGIEALSAGERLTRRHRWSAAMSDRPLPEEGWTVFAIGVDAIWAAFTEPDAP